jgi:predicted nucleic acid-binding protein
MIVIDACSVISWALNDENGDAADAVVQHAAREGAVVPSNFWAEIVHALVRAERRNRVDDTTATLMLTEIMALPLTEETPDSHAVLSLARKYQVSGYDAAYLALSLQTQMPLATVDAALGTAAKAAKCAWKARA